MKAFARWCLAGILAIAVVALIIYLFTVLITPVTDWITAYLAGKIEGEPAELAEPYGILEDDLCNFSISGQVTRNDGVPVANAEIKIYNAGLYEMGDLRYTDGSGHFSYSEMGADICEKEQLFLLIRKNGFQPSFRIAVPDEQIRVSLTSLYYF